MPRAVPSTWEPVDFDAAFGVEHLFDAGRREAILQSLGDGSADRQKRFMDWIFNTAGCLNAELHFAAAPTSGSMEAAIKPFAKAVELALQKAEALDYSSLQFVHAAADRDAICNSRRSNETPRMSLPITHEGETIFVRNSLGPERLRLAKRALEDLARWSVVAVQSASSANPPYRTNAKEATRDAIQSLGDLWTEAWGSRTDKDLTLSALKPFAHLALDPVFKRYGDLPDLEHAIEDVLHRL